MVSLMQDNLALLQVQGYTLHNEIGSVQYSFKELNIYRKSLMTRKTVDFNKTGISKLPDDKPVVYKILTGSGKNNYTGVAKRGRVQERLAEHLPGGKNPVPGAKVQIDQAPRVDQALKRESRIISRSSPRYNKQGKS